MRHPLLLQCQNVKCPSSMNSLRLPPDAFGQKLRMKLNSLTSDQSLLVLEGKSDSSALLKFFNSDVHFQAAQGKMNALSARNYLSEEENERILYVVDCDGDEARGSYTSIPNVIITETRDLESDFFLVHKSFESLLQSAYAAQEVSFHSSEAHSYANRIGSYTLQIASDFCRVRSLANKLNLPTKVRFDELGSQIKPRKLGIRDVPNIDTICKNLDEINFETYLEVGQNKLNWTLTDIERIKQLDRNRSNKNCKMHKEKDCPSCAIRLFANGHEIVDLAARVYYYHVLQKSLDFEIDYHDFSSNLFGRVNNSPMDWSLIQRTRLFENWSNRRLLDPRFHRSKSM